MSRKSKALATPRRPIAYGTTPDRFTYALKQYTVEIRPDGWWMTPTHPASGRPTWQGPFVSIEDVCLAMARVYATEIANRHSVLTGHHGIGKTHPLHGLKPTTRLRPKART